MQEDLETLSRLSTALSGLATKYRSANLTLRAFLDDRRRKAATYKDSLQGLDRDERSNKIYLDLAKLETYLTKYRCHRPSIDQAATNLQQGVFLKRLGQSPLDQIRSLVESDPESLNLAIDEIIFPELASIHDRMVGTCDAAPILTTNLLDELEREYRSAPSTFESALKDFIAGATCLAKLDSNQHQPKDLREDSNMPLMPRKSFVLGLPKDHSFSRTIKEMIPTLIPAGDSTTHGFYEHDDPTQIRLLFGATWMAARFAEVVGKLEAIFMRDLAKDHNGELAYFTSLDQSGEDQRRPPLLLPSPKESRSVMRAALWIGQKLSSPATNESLIQEGSDRVVLLIDTKSGPKTIRIGPSIRELNESADITTIYRVHDTVCSRIPSLRIEERSALRDEVDAVDKEIRQKHGRASQEYSDWQMDRDQISKILNQ